MMIVMLRGQLRIKYEYDYAEQTHFTPIYAKHIPRLPTTRPGKKCRQ
jgi:hypothetical protein